MNLNYIADINNSDGINTSCPPLPGLKKITFLFTCEEPVPAFPISFWAPPPESNTTLNYLSST